MCDASFFLRARNAFAWYFKICTRCNSLNGNIGRFHSIRNDWKNKHFPATPCFKLAYKSVNETIFLLSIITRYHRLALALPQFAELNRSSGPRLIGPFTTKSRFYRFSKRT